MRKRKRQLKRQLLQRYHSPDREVPGMIESLEAYGETICQALNNFTRKFRELSRRIEEFNDLFKKRNNSHDRSKI